MSFDLLLAGGEIVFPGVGVRTGSVAVKDGRIAALLAPGEQESAREVIDCRGKWVMVDLGMTFADPNSPGVDLVLPDLAFIEERRKDLLGVVLTHGHEDHIGAIPYLALDLGVPLYATPFTAGLIRRKLEEEGIEFKYNQKIDVTKLPEGFDAYVVSTGTPTARDLKIPGRELKGVYFALELLSRFKIPVVYDERRDAVIFRPFQGISVGVVAENERYFYGRNTGVDYSLEVRAAPRNEYRNAHFLHFDFPEVLALFE